MTIPSIKSAAILALIALDVLAFPSSSRAADDPRASQLKFEPWNKTCLGKTDCFVGRDARGVCVPSGGAVAVHTVNGRVVSFIANFGTTRGLDGDINVQIDQDQPIHIPHRECYPFNCGSEFTIDEDVVERLKRSNTITIEATTTAHRRITLAFPLADFARAYDGPGTEPKVIEEIVSNEEMKARLVREEATKPPPCEE